MFPQNILIAFTLISFCQLSLATVSRSEFEKYPGLTNEKMFEEGEVKVLTGELPNSSLNKFRVELQSPKGSNEKRTSEATFTQSQGLVIAALYTKIQNAKGQLLSSTHCAHSVMPKLGNDSAAKSKLVCMTTSLDFCDLVDKELRASNLTSQAAQDLQVQCSAFTSALDGFWANLDKSALASNEYSKSVTSDIAVLRGLANRINPGMGGDITSRAISMTDPKLKIDKPALQNFLSATKGIHDLIDQCETFRKEAPPKPRPPEPKQKGKSSAVSA